MSLPTIGAGTPPARFTSTRGSEAGQPPLHVGSRPGTRTQPRVNPKRKPGVAELIDGRKGAEEVFWGSSASVRASTAPHEVPPARGAATPEPGGKPRRRSPGRSLALQRTRLDDDVSASDITAMARSRPGTNQRSRAVPLYSLSDLDGGTDASRAAVVNKWPASSSASPVAGPSSSGLVDLDVSTTTPGFLGQLTQFLTFELQHVPANEGAAGALNVCRQAFDYVTEAFASYAVVFSTIRDAYERRIDELEADVARTAQRETLLEEERARCSATEEQCKNAVAAEKAEADRSKRRLITAQHDAAQAIEALKVKADEMRRERDEAVRNVVRERAARREAEDNVETYKRMHDGLKEQWDEAKAEVVAFRTDASTALRDLERDKRVAEGSLALVQDKHAKELKQLRAEIEALRTSSLTPQQVADMNERSREQAEQVRKLQRQIEWLQRELEAKNSHEAPVRWRDIDDDCADMQRAGASSHDIALRLAQRQRRASRAEARLRERLAAVQQAESFLSGSAAAYALAPAADAEELRPLTEAGEPWALPQWRLADLSPDGPLSTLPPSVHQHEAVRGFVCAALIAQSTLKLPTFVAALDRVCNTHCDFRNAGAFFTTVAHRLRTTFAADPFIGDFALSLLEGKRPSLAHSQQLLLQCRALSAALEALEKSASGRVTGTIPKDALLAALPNAFPLKDGAQLAQLRCALFQHYDGTMTAAGVVTNAGLASTSAEKASRWNGIAALAYSDVLGPLHTGGASPVLVALCEQYSRGVRTAERALDETINALADGNGGRFKDAREYHEHLVRWATASTFAAEMVLGVPRDGPHPSPPETPIGNMSFTSSVKRSGTLGASLFEKSLRAAAKASGSAPVAALAKPERVADALCRAAVLRTSAASGVDGAFPGDVIAAQPSRASYGPESYFRDTPTGKAGSPARAADDAEEDDFIDSPAPIEAADAIAAACAVLPAHGVFFVQLAAGAYNVAPDVLAAYAAAFSSGINLAAGLHYDVGQAQVAPPVATASPKKEGGKRRK